MHVQPVANNMLVNMHLYICYLRIISRSLIFLQNCGWTAAYVIFIPMAVGEN